MRKLIFILLLIPVLGIAQNKLDSLFNIWQDQTQKDTTRLSAIKKFIDPGLLFDDPDSAIYFAASAYKFAEHKASRYWMAEFLNLQGICFATKGDNSKAIVFYERAKTLYDEIGRDENVFGVLSNLGVAYFDQGNIYESLEYYNKSLAGFETLGNKKRSVYCLGNIGNIYFGLRDYDMALAYYNRSLELTDKNQPVQNLILIDIAKIYTTQKNMMMHSIF